MTDTTLIMDMLDRGDYDGRMSDIYRDVGQLPYQRKRYKKAIQSFEDYFGCAAVEIYSAPGRSEIGGNHTDHQHGEVLAASINKDIIAVVGPMDEDIVQVISDGFDMIHVSLDDLAMQDGEKESATALVRGVLGGMRERGYRVGGFRAYLTSDVLIGAGLSSSAAFEIILAAIESGLYNDMAVSAVDMAVIGQYAESVYFGKPCGLMDQVACSVGNLVHIDFAVPGAPKVERIDFDLGKHGYSLCITDTKGSHADLTSDYAAIPAEMRQVADFFGKEVLLGVTKEMLIDKIVEVRKVVGDRALLRALHFISDNKRVQKEVEALKSGQIGEFLRAARESGDSSFKYLQNVYSSSDIKRQSLSIALALSDMFLGEDGVSRVHGGGFAGTIQAFVKSQAAAGYQEEMDRVFGEGSCSILKIRKYGGMKVL